MNVKEGYNMDDLMARTMVENLSIGIDPVTGCVLSTGDSCANEVVQEALKTVLEHCALESYATILERQRKEKKGKQEKARQKRAAARADQSSRQGVPWTRDEEQKMKVLYDNGYSASQIAALLRRSPSAVRIRLNDMLAWRKS